MTLPESLEEIQSEYDYPEDFKPSSQDLRIKALVLLLVFLLPSIFIILEVLTGQVSGWWNENAVPLIPHIELVHF